MSITVFTTALDLSPSWARSIQSPSNSLNNHFNIILQSTLKYYEWSVSLSCFPYALHAPPMNYLRSWSNVNRHVVLASKGTRESNHRPTSFCCVSPSVSVGTERISAVKQASVLTLEFKAWRPLCISKVCSDNDVICRYTNFILAISCI